MNMPTWADVEFALIASAATAFVVAGALGIGLYFRWLSARENARSGFESPVISEWRSTGQIDFVGSDEAMKAEDENAPA
jgi:hypothetical protein